MPISFSDGGDNRLSGILVFEIINADLISIIFSDKHVWFHFTAMLIDILGILLGESSRRGSASESCW